MISLMESLMKKILIAFCITMLIGCGHGFEGEYISKPGSSNNLIGSFAKALGGDVQQKVVIGSDYLESEGKRAEFDDIFVRESGKDSYLVFKDGDSEEAWKIIDKNTLIQSLGFMELKLERVN